MVSKFLAHVDEIEEGKAKVVTLENGDEIALFKIEGKIYALNNACPHKGGPLGEGMIEDGTLTCPWHGWQFDPITGECYTMPGEFAEKVEVTVEGNEIILNRGEDPLER